MTERGWKLNVKQAYSVAGVVVVGAAMLGCNMLPAQIPVKAEDRDFVTDAKAAVSELKADYVLTKGMGALMQQKVDEFLYVEDGLKLGRVKWKTFRSELNSCWQTPVETLKGVEQRAVSTVDAAKHFQNKTAFHQLRVIQDSGQNAFDRVKACPQSLTEKVAGFPKRAKEDSVAWGQGKLALVNEVRVLVKDEVPNRLATLGETAVSAPTTVAKQIAQAETYRKTLEQLGDAAALKSNGNQLKTLRALQSESKTLASTVQSDASVLSEMVSESGTKMSTGISRFGKK
ncbi:MAG: hypothetical protein ACI9OJ_005584 [Myxococcota bacterium]|jgi:hypothetical protein